MPFAICGIRQLIAGFASLIPVLICFIMLSTEAATAQFNDSIHHYVYYNSTGNINKTNDGNSYILNNLLKFSVSKKNMALNTMNSYIYGKQADIKTNSDVSSTIDFNIWKPRSKFYFWGLGAFDKSYSLKINHRVQGGAGIGYTIINHKNGSLGVSDGILFEKGDLTDAELGQLHYQILRNSFRLKYRWTFNDMIVLDGVGFLQPSITTRHDTIIKYTTTLSVKLKKWLSLTTGLTYNKVTLSERENLLVTYGLVLERFF